MLCSAEKSFSVADRTRERATVVAKQFAFRKRLRNGAAVDRSKSEAVALVVQPMNRLCQHLLAGTGFTFDQHRNIADLRGLIGSLKKRNEFRGVADETKIAKEALKYGIGKFSFHDGLW